MVKKRKETILVVDDEPAIFISIKLILSKDYKLIYYKDAASALKYLKKKSALPSLILLDVIMPGIDGMGFLDALREKNLQIPVIMLSAINTAKAAADAFHRGAVDYIVKPFTHAEVVSKINKALKRECA